MNVWENAIKLPVSTVDMGYGVGVKTGYYPNGPSCELRVSSVYVADYGGTCQIKIPFPEGSFYRPTVSLSIKGNISGMSGQKGNLYVYIYDNNGNSDSFFGIYSFDSDNVPINFSGSPRDINSAYYGYFAIFARTFNTKLSDGSYLVPTMTVNIDEMLFTINGVKYRAEFI